MDGYLSASMIYVYIKTLYPSINIIPFLHHKQAKAHGLGDEDVFKQIKKCEPSLLIIPDAGSNDEKECAKLRKLGWDIQISDHHFSKEYNKECILVNNHASSNVINKGLCGCGVTWKCLKRYDELYGHNIASTLISYVAFANVSDSMSLIYQENRAFSKWGFKKIHKNLQPFFDEFIPDGEIVNESVAWNITPKGNALIRLGELQDKIDFFYALCGEYDACDIIERMKKYHNRQGTEKTKLLSDVDIIYNGTCILAKTKNKTPLTGLIANSMSSDYRKPILLVHDSDGGQSAGSVRSIFPIKKQLLDSGLLDYAEGHEDFAFGIAYKTDKEQQLIDYLDTSVVVCEPHIEVLTSSVIKSIPMKLYSLKTDYNELWSKGISQPLIHIPPFTIKSSDIQCLGSDKRTLKLTSEGIDFMMFRVSKLDKENFHVGENVRLSVELVVELGLNIWNNRVKPQAIIKNYEVKINERKLEDFY